MAGGFARRRDHRHARHDLALSVDQIKQADFGDGADPYELRRFEMLIWSVVPVDAGYWHNAQMQAIEDRGIEVLAPPDGNMRQGKRPGWDRDRYQRMRDKLTSDRGRELYAQRKVTIEPVFGQIKHNRRIERFMRRGRAAARSEWRLVTATHNLLKLHSHWITNTT